MIQQKRSIIPALDTTDIVVAENIVKETTALPFIGAYKVGFSLGLKYGLPRVVERLRHYSDLPIIYDHQKAATDIPDTGDLFASILTDAGISMAILFPFTGPAVQSAWTQALTDRKITAILGGEMTHDKFFNKDDGYLDYFSPEKIYTKAAVAGIRHFVMPGNKPEKIQRYKQMLTSVTHDPITIYSPGLVTQGGEISESGKVAGDNWHCIVGRALIQAQDIAKAAQTLGQQLNT